MKALLICANARIVVRLSRIPIIIQILSSCGSIYVLYILQMARNVIIFMIINLIDKSNCYYGK